ncbi:MetQ/NlpA family ABC transporter substrate-binding protein [Marinococcus luteus]|uniref:MetQ/NlpA family ABC transporter substrate-binding protein n=1 Tax=Marinococcus luteus TaxID=1122204 RepID=UPI002ACC97BE|nr:MetQ/NlpA family ABC transporter substrate-binding protein [Marinococcus luteus]MDZ5783569.1 MetQ/NlpA family ABC transporter substrate-binding protein [Marinococcus luteus]
MKKTLLGVSLLSAAVLAACGSDSESSGSSSGEETETLAVGATSVPHAEILEFAEDQLAEENVELEIETFNDYIVPNESLASEEIDANYFQHIPYLEDQMEENDNFNFVNMGGIHIEPIGVYSQEYDSLDALPDGAEIIMSNSVADHGRILQMLEQEGVLTLEEGAGVEATVDDIAENPKNLQFQADIEAATLPQVYNNGEGDAVFINSNYAIDADLNPQEDAIALESPEDNPYVNVIAAREEDENNETIQTLVDVLQSDETQEFIEEEYDGAVIPAEQE